MQVLALGPGMKYMQENGTAVKVNKPAKAATQKYVVAPSPKKK